MITTDAGAPLVSEHHMFKGKELAAKLLDILVQEDPRTALVALLIAFPMTTKACGLAVWQCFEAMRAFDRGTGGPEERTQRLGRGLIVTP